MRPVKTMSEPKAAEMLGVSVYVMRKLRTERQISSLRIGDRHRYTEEAIAEYLRRATLPADCAALI